MTFDEVWKQVKGLSDVIMVQVPSVLSESTKKRLCKRRPEEIKVIVDQAIEEVNHGSIEPLDTLIKRRL